MRHLKLLRALVGSAGLLGCIGLLASQARADIVEFYPAPAVAEDSAEAPVAADAERSSDPLVTFGNTHRDSTVGEPPQSPGSGLVRRMRELLAKAGFARPAD